MNDISMIQKRPGMYIGDTRDGTGLHNLVLGLTGNAIAQVLRGRAEQIDVILHRDLAATVRFAGPRVEEVDDLTTQAIARREAATCLPKSILLSIDTADVVGGLLGFDTCTVNALSVWMRDRCWRGDAVHEWRFRGGNLDEAFIPELPVAFADQGVAVSFLPDPRFFASTMFDAGWLDTALTDLSRHNGGVRIKLSDERAVQ